MSSRARRFDSIRKSGLPEIKDNLEARLIALRKRLEGEFYGYADRQTEHLLRCSSGQISPTRARSPHQRSHGVQKTRRHPRGTERALSTHMPTLSKSHFLKPGFLVLAWFAAACGDSGDGDNTGSGGTAASGSGGTAASGSGGSAASGSGGTAASGSGGTAASGSGGTAASGLPVNLGTASSYVILAKTGISTVPTSAITGDIGVSPAAASLITGFSLTADPTNVFSTCPQVTGRVYAADFAPPTPSDMTTAVSDMELAFTDAAGRAAGVTELGAGNIGGMTLAPGVYHWGTGLLIPTDVTLTGSATDVWIFQVAQDLTVSSGAKVALTGGALPKNVFWQVAGLVDLGTTAHWEGVVLTQTSITLQTGASIKGRLLAQTAVNIDGSTVVEPAQ